LGPHEKGGIWKLEGIEGANRFLQKVWRLCDVAASSLAQSQNELDVKMHQTIKKVTEDIENLRFNTAISALMEYVNLLQEKGASEENLEVLVKLLAPFAPHMTEEIYQHKLQTKKFKSVHLEAWPEWNKNKIQEDVIEVAVQVNGKLRATVKSKS
jgi:leucyl-tRNA synthetase